jgi:hypothetical protein
MKKFELEKMKIRFGEKDGAFVIPAGANISAGDILVLVCINEMMDIDDKDFDSASKLIRPYAKGNKQFSIWFE